MTDHAPVTFCRVCLETWPCQERQLLKVAANAEYELRNGCLSCGKPVKNAGVKMNGRRWCTRSSCLADALAYAAVNHLCIWRAGAGHPRKWLVLEGRHHEIYHGHDEMLIGCGTCIKLSRSGGAPWVQQSSSRS